MNTFIHLYIKKLTKTASIPKPQHEGDLGYDLAADETLTLQPGKYQLVSTGIAADGDGFGFLIRDRSGMATKGIITHAGVIDAGYRGEIKILLHNISDEPYTIKQGERVAQMIPMQPNNLFISQVTEFEETSRNAGGFGSTGK